MLGIPFLDDAVTKWFKPQVFDDPIDRLNYFATATMLAFFAIMVSAKQYVGSPIQCFMPMEFKGGWEQYAEDFCFIQNTYYVPMLEAIPETETEREDAQFSYYQWVPVVLALQAIMFYLPNWVWRTLHQQSGIDLNTCVSDAQKMRNMHAEGRKVERARLCQYIGESLEMHENHRVARQVLCLRLGRNLGSYVAALYLGVKLLYCINIALQFYILNRFLGTEYVFWGVQILMQLWSGNDWEDTSVFPRVTLCDFKVRRLANIHNYTVQCVLMINMFNEKIFIFIWFWFAFVMIATILNFIYSAVNLMLPSARNSTVRGYLKHFEQITNDPATKNVVNCFVNKALCPDGVLLLRFIEGHAGAIVAREVTATLFANYLNSIKDLIPEVRSHDISGTKSTTPGGDDYYEKHHAPSPTYKDEKHPLMEVDSGRH